MTDDQILDAMVEHPILVNRPIVVTLKGELGCEVIEAGSGVEALARLEERPAVSLMFTACPA